jgi:hypothetical protein
MKKKTEVRGRKSEVRKVRKRRRRKTEVGDQKSEIREQRSNKTMAKKKNAEYEDAGDTPAATAEGTIQPREGEEFLPPPDPPVVPSPPFPPPAPDAVDESEKGAQPEATALRELELLQVGTRGEGPAPEEPVIDPPPPEG